MKPEIDKIKEASRNFGAIAITKYYLESGMLDAHTKSTLVMLQEQYFKGKGLEPHGR